VRFPSSGCPQANGLIRVSTLRAKEKSGAVLTTADIPSVASGSTPGDCRSTCRARSPPSFREDNNTQFIDVWTAIVRSFVHVAREKWYTWRDYI